jgi:putative membrane protein
LGRGLWPIGDLAFLNSTNSIKYILLGTVLVADHWIVAYLKYQNFTFFLDNENEEFIINEGIFNKTKQLFS